MKNQLKSKIVLLAAFAVMMVFSVSLNAQRPGRQSQPRMQAPVNRPDSALVDRMVGRMAEELSLTDSQKEKIRELHYAHIADARQHRENMRAEAEKHRAEMDKTRDEMDKAIKNVLTEEQKEKFDADRPGRGPGRYGPDCPYRGPRQGKGPGRRGYYCPNR